MAPWGMRSLGSTPAGASRDFPRRIPEAPLGAFPLPAGSSLTRIEPPRSPEPRDGGCPVELRTPPFVHVDATPAERTARASAERVVRMLLRNDREPFAAVT